MNEEEKEAIEQLKSWREYIIKNKEKVNKANDLEFYIRIVLNLITKLQKENEEKDKQIDLMADEIIMTKPINCTKTNEFSTKKNYMSKEEIKKYFADLVEKE